MVANCPYKPKCSTEENNSDTSTETDARNSFVSSAFCSLGGLNNRFLYVQTRCGITVKNSPSPQSGSARRFRCKTVKMSSSLITLSPRFEGLKVAAVPQGKRDLTVFDFRMYLNPDRTETGDFVGPLSEVVFGSTHPFHRSLVSIKRFKKRLSALLCLGTQYCA